MHKFLCEYVVIFLGSTPRNEPAGLRGNFMWTFWDTATVAHRLHAHEQYTRISLPPVLQSSPTTAILLF